MTGNYIHGFSTGEQQRLVRQARILAPAVFKNMDFSGAESVLEPGCAVGAELKELLQRWPHLKCTGLDISASHLGAAKKWLKPEIDAGTITLVEGNATIMPFKDNAFDRIITIWMLEHVDEPVKVLNEAWRVLKPGGIIICTEVDNATFGFYPERPRIDAWWQQFNRYQRGAGGHPCIGSKLQELAGSLPFTSITAVPAPIISSQDEPRRYLELLNYLEELLLSGADSMKQSGLIDSAAEAGLKEEFSRIRQSRDVEFQYHAVRLTCKK